MTIRNSKRARYTVEAYERGYRVGPDGELYSPMQKVLRPGANNRGYRRFAIRIDGGHALLFVHQLAAYQTFGAEALAEGVHVRHLDGDSLNNSPDNLAIGSPRDNVMDRPAQDRLNHARHAASHKRRLTQTQAQQLRNDHRSGMRLADVAEKYNIAKSTASYIVNHKTYRSLG